MKSKIWHPRRIMTNFIIVLNQEGEQTLFLPRERKVRHQNTPRSSQLKKYISFRMRSISDIDPFLLAIFTKRRNKSSIGYKKQSKNDCPYPFQSHNSTKVMSMSMSMNILFY